MKLDDDQQRLTVVVAQLSHPGHRRREADLVALACRAGLARP
jgi:hypothetical protein